MNQLGTLENRPVAGLSLLAAGPACCARWGATEVGVAVLMRRSFKE